MKMRFEFGVAHQSHMAGANPDKLDKCRFADYYSADEYADGFRDECEPTIYLIVEGKYVFHCKTVYGGNDLAWVYHLESKPWGQIETRIWWKEFKANPEKFFDLAQAVL